LRHKAEVNVKRTFSLPEKVVRSLPLGAVPNGVNVVVRADQSGVMQFRKADRPLESTARLVEHGIAVEVACDYSGSRGK
jgi:hypothetical protein